MNTSLVAIKRARPRLWPLLALAALVLTLPAAGQITSTPWKPIFKGIDLAYGTNAAGWSGNQHVVRALRVDLQDPDVRIFTTPPNTNNWLANSRETYSHRTGNFLRENQLRVAINGAHFGGNTAYSAPDGSATWIHGPAISQGVLVSPADTSVDALSLLYFTTNMVPEFIPYNGQGFSDTNGIYTAIPGMYPLVVNGVNVGWDYLNNNDTTHRVQPRTAIGISADRRYVIMLVIDGRQSDSDGAKDYETADWLIRFGAYNGMNLDGGGSTCMVMANECGDPVILNDPSIYYATGGQTTMRSVGHNIGFYAKSLPTDPLQNSRVTAGRSMAIVQWDTPFRGTTQVEYGLTPALGNASPLIATPTTNHTVLLTGLPPGRTNYFRLLSRSNQVEFASPVCFFLTQTNPPPVGSGSAPMELLFDVTQSWKYNTNSMDNTPAWKTPAYNDSAWGGPGPGLLYVEDSEYVYPKNTPLPSPRGPGVPSASPQLPITYYFRTTFVFPTEPSGVSLVFSNLIDDGAVFYLNGTEVYRLRMPAAPAVITSTPLANGFPAGPPTYQQGVHPQYGDAAAEAPALFTLSGSLVSTNLVRGTNWLAVEVHNYSAGSPDIVFGTALYYTRTTLQTNSLIVLASDLSLSVPVTLAANDNYGMASGVTPFERFYYPHASATLTATQNMGNLVFKEWRLDGATFSTNLTITISMSTSHVAEVVYVAPAPMVYWTLGVLSSNPNADVGVVVQPADTQGLASADTPFTRIYTNGTAVTLTAPATVNGKLFAEWRLDGVTASTNRAFVVVMTTNRMVTAVYQDPPPPPVWALQVHSFNPAEGVPIEVQPADTNQLTGALTPFLRYYSHQTQVTLNAPALAGNHRFQHWVLDGSMASTQLLFALTLETNRTVTAVYQPPPAPPLLGVWHGGGQLILDWAGSGFVLQTTTNLQPPIVWTNVPGPVTSGPYTNPARETLQFFRLQELRPPLAP
ncbi:MAG: phosphodiester glycosidase family protein [Verrucomicrobiae bacterium]|nr:phosphodiester glycosidase family protein [Verrucomicrobiae bacterium]